MNAAGPSDRLRLASDEAKATLDVVADLIVRDLGGSRARHDIDGAECRVGLDLPEGPEEV